MHELVYEAVVRQASEVSSNAGVSAEALLSLYTSPSLPFVLPKATASDKELEILLCRTVS